MDSSAQRPHVLRRAVQSLDLVVHRLDLEREDCRQLFLRRHPGRRPHLDFMQQRVQPPRHQGCLLTVGEPKAE